MPQYAVAQDPEIRTRVLPRRVKTPDEEAVLPTSKLPDAVTVAPRYNVSPQSGADPLMNQFESWLSGAMQPQAPAAVAPMAAPAPEVPTLAQPVEADDPATAGLKRAASALQTAKDKPIEKNSRLKSFLKMAAYALGQSRPGKDWADVAMQAGQGIGGGIGGAIQPDTPGIMKKEYEVKRAEGDLVTAEKYANTVSLTERRADQTRLGDLTFGQKAKAADLNAKYKEYLMREGKRRNDSTIERQKFLISHAKDVFADKVTQEAWVRDIGERKLNENIRQFNSKDEIARANLVVNQRRAASYEASVKAGITGKAAELAADAAEGQAFIDAADEFDAAIEGLDPTEDYDEILTLKKAKIAAIKQGRAKLAGAQAAGGVRGVVVTPDKTPTMPMRSTKPKSDPLGIFR